MRASICPECAQGKCVNCAREALNDQDRMVPCRCPECGACVKCGHPRGTHIGNEWGRTACGHSRMGSVCRCSSWTPAPPLASERIAEPDPRDLAAEERSQRAIDAANEEPIADPTKENP